LLAGNAAFIPTAYESIATVTVGSGGIADFTFTSIPSTYTHLQIRAYWGFTDTGNNTWLNTRFNSDSGTNYAYHSLRANGSTLSAATQRAQTSMPFVYALRALRAPGLSTEHWLVCSQQAQKPGNGTLNSQRMTGAC
jgi:hypothetical protein